MKGFLLILAFLLVWSGVGVETLVFVEEPSAAKALDMIRTGVLDLYGAGITEPGLLHQNLKGSTVSCSPTYNAVWHLSFNPAGPIFIDGRLNPFADPRGREALNWLVNRDHIVQEILGGAGFPQVLPLRPIFPDYARLAQVARPLELLYGYDPERARTVFFEVMPTLGAELREGRWIYQGNPVEIRILIRTDARRFLGDYLAQLLQGLGFQVTPIYASYGEALRIMSAPPEEGRWHIYTNSLVVSLIERDEASTFQLNYTPAFPYPPWQYLSPAPALAELAQRLARGDYSSLREREDLMAQALRLAMEDSSQVWLAVRAACYPRATDLGLAVDLGAGLRTGLWCRTLVCPRETVRVAVPSLLSAPWNPVGGSFTTYDQMIIRATVDSAVLPHPYSGLYFPVDLVRAEVAVREGLPMQKSSDWIDLRFLSTIPVPEEAWLDWDPLAARFRTVGEIYPQGISATARVTLTFREDLWRKTWHDGSPLSLGDFLLRLILLFDRAKPESLVYDETALPLLEKLKAHLRGVIIKGVDPLVVEVYTDLRFLDAEWLVAEAAELVYPWYEQGPGPWHVLALLLGAEAQGKLALSQAKAKVRGVEWANLLAGPSVALLAGPLKEVTETGFLPYANFLEQFVSKEERGERYAALARFYEAHGHFWVGNGPFYLDVVKPVEKVLVLRRWSGYLEPLSDPSGLAALPLPWVEVQGPKVLSGEAAQFTVTVGSGDKPLPPEEILFVKYLFFDASQMLVAWGLAEPGPAGFSIALGPEILGSLGTGPARLEVVAALNQVTLAAHGLFSFLVVGGGS